jgi:hypothetical protein
VALAVVLFAAPDDGHAAAKQPRAFVRRLHRVLRWVATDLEHRAHGLC